MKDISATVIVNLEPSLDKIIWSLQKDARWGIKKAEREGLIVKIIEKNSSEWDNSWSKFYPIYLGTLNKTGVKFETLLHLRDNATILVLCLREKEIIAGAALDIVNGAPKLVRNGSLKEFQKLQPNNLLYWECIKWSKNKGYSRLDLGGWQINPNAQEKGVNEFKERWGNIVYVEKEYSLSRAVGRKIVRRFRWLKNLSKLINGLN